MSLPLDRNASAEEPEKQKCLLANREDTIPRRVSADSALVVSSTTTDSAKES
jgi:hypothetical protein